MQLHKYAPYLSRLCMIVKFFSYLFVAPYKKDARECILLGFYVRR